MWTPCRLHVVAWIAISSGYEVYMDFTWTLVGGNMDYMDFRWSLLGVYKESTRSTWSLHGVHKDLWGSVKYRHPSISPRVCPYPYLGSPAEEDSMEDCVWEFGPVLASQQQFFLTFDVPTFYTPTLFSTAWLLSWELRDWNVGLSVATQCAPRLFRGEQWKSIVPWVRNRLSEPLSGLSFLGYGLTTLFPHTSFGLYLYHMLQILLIIFSSLTVVVRSDRCESMHVVIFQCIIVFRWPATFWMQHIFSGFSFSPIIVKFCSLQERTELATHQGVVRVFLLS
jgi:hypothetical protein